MSEKQVFELLDAVLVDHDRPLLHLDKLVFEKGVHCIVGPVGAGKSSVLSALCGQPLRDGVCWSGTLTFQQRNLMEQSTRNELQNFVHFEPQQALSVGLATVSTPEAIERLHRIESSTRSVLLLDEPERGCSPSDQTRLLQTILKHGENGLVVLVCHSLHFIRQLQATVHLITSKRRVCSLSVHDFFHTSKDPLVTQFTATGSCSEAPEAPQLPAHFHWIIPNKLAGMGRPGLLRDVDLDLEAIALAGVRLVVTLTEQPFSKEKLSSFGLEGRHFPIVDMGVPSVRDTMGLCKQLTKAQQSGDVVVVHCHAGLGRTGLILASMLIWSGTSADDALEKVRSIEPRYVQNQAQERFLRLFSMQVGG